MYFFSNFNDDIDEKMVKKMSSILYVEFVGFKNFYSKKALIKQTNYNRNNLFNKSIDLFPKHIRSFKKIINDFMKPHKIINNFVRGQSFLEENLINL